MTTKAAILHAYVPPDAPIDEQDTLEEAGFVSEALKALGYEPASVPMTLDLAAAASALRAMEPLFVFNLVEALEGKGRLIHLGGALLDHLVGAGGGANAEQLVGLAPLQAQKNFPTRNQADKSVEDSLRTRMTSTDANDFLYQVDSSRNYNPAPHLDKITAPLLHINSADDFINPPELGLAEKLITRVRRGRFVLLPATAETRGHGTHTWAALWKQHLAALRALVAYLSSPLGGANWAKAGFDLSPNKGAQGNYTDPALGKKGDMLATTKGFVPGAQQRQARVEHFGQAHNAYRSPQCKQPGLSLSLMPAVFGLRTIRLIRSTHWPVWQPRAIQGNGGPTRSPRRR